MTDRDVLSQEEIDALLTSVQDGAVDGNPHGPGDAVDAQPYDLTRPAPAARGRLRTLELLGEKLARRLRANLKQVLRYPVEVTCGGVEMQSFADLSASLPLPTSLTLVRVQPFAGAGLVIIDAELVSRLVDLYFGGAGRPVSIGPRDFTPTEKRIIRRVLEVLFADLTAVWGEVLPVAVELTDQEFDPSLLDAFAADDVMMINEYRLELSSGGGRLQVVLPTDALEPYREILGAQARTEETERDAAWSPALQRSLLETQVPLRCPVAEATLKLRELMKLQVGDVIPVEMPEANLVLAGEMPAFYARLGESKGNLALEYHGGVDRG